jgi:uncharacterized cupin superfamily protein
MASWLLRANARGPEANYSHPMNPHSEIHGFMLSRATGLLRCGVNFVRVPPGKESFAYHEHKTEEEWLYVLAGRGVAIVNEEEVEVGAGDFLGFPAPGFAHHLKNPFAEDLVYLSGGEHVDVEVADFPHHGKRMIRIGEAMAVHDIDGSDMAGTKKL